MTFQTISNDTSTAIDDVHQDTNCKLHPSDYGYINWLEFQQSIGFDLFKLDVTFNSSGSPNSDNWLDYYDRKVVHKIRQNIGFDYRINCLVREYESDIHSRTYRGFDWRNPHHIHAIVAVPNDRSCKMTSRRMVKDIASMRLVSSVQIVDIPEKDFPNDTFINKSTGRKVPPRTTTTGLKVAGWIVAWSEEIRAQPNYSLLHAYAYMRKGKTWRPLQ